MRHLIILSVSAGTGGIVGYLAGGDRAGAQIGALVNVALFSGLLAASGQAGGFAESTGPRVAYGALALGSAAGAGYLIRRRR